MVWNEYEALRAFCEERVARLILERQVTDLLREARPRLALAARLKHFWDGLRPPAAETVLKAGLYEEVGPSPGRSS